MINLLPPDLKQSYIYAQRNTHLLRWIVAFLLAIVGLGVIATYGYLYMNKSVTDYSHKVASTQTTLKDQQLTQTEAQVKDITNSLKLVVQVLSKEVLFSKLLTQMATVIPANTLLTQLNIAKVQGSIDITAITANYNTATQLQVNLQDPANKIFSKADIENITCSPQSAQDPRYPCTVSIRALFATNNPFLFINNAGAK